MIYVSDKCIPNEAVSTGGAMRGAQENAKRFPEVLTDAFLFLATPLSPSARLHKSCLCNDNSATLPAGEQKGTVRGAGGREGEGR